MTKDLLKKIAAISWPAIVINITTPLLAISDITIAGHLGSAVFIAAIAVGSTLFNMLYWLLGFLRMGTTGLTAQAYGARDTAETVLIPLRALGIALITGVALIALQGPLCPALLSLLDAEGATRVLAGEYFDICIWGAPAMLGTFVLTGWFVGMQDSRTPMWISIGMDLLNIAVSVTLAIGFGMGVKGIATGTLCSQWSGFIVSGWIFARRRSGYDKHEISLRDFAHAGKISRLLRINADIFLRTLCLVAVTMWFTRTGASQGPTMLAVNALLMQMFTLFSFFCDGIAFAAEALCGKHRGEGDEKRLGTAVRSILTVALITALIFSATYLLLGRDFLRLLSDDTEVVNLAGEYYLWVVFIPLAGFAAFIWDGVCIGLTHTRSMLVSMALAVATFFACYGIAFPHMHNHGLWLAFIMYLAVRGLSLTLIWRRYLRQRSYSAR